MISNLIKLTRRSAAFRPQAIGQFGLFKHQFGYARLFSTIEDPYLNSTPQFNENVQRQVQKRMIEREIQKSIAKLERLSSLLPQGDKMKIKAENDLTNINDKFSDLMFKTEDDDDDEQTEFQIKKLMTVAKSKYYMLKVNYPKLAEQIDSEPLVPDMQGQNEFTDTRETTQGFNPDVKDIPLQSMVSEGEAPVDMSVVKEARQKHVQGIRERPVTPTLDDLSSPEAKRAMQEVLDADQIALKKKEEEAEAIIGNMEIFKILDKLNEESGAADRFKNIQYVDREEPTELVQKQQQEEQMYDAHLERVKPHMDGELTLDAGGNLGVKMNDKQWNRDGIKSDDGQGIQSTGTYVLRDGKLVEGKAEVREKATYSNWYCSNADPEDLRRHRELMDRQHYKGPQWEGKSIPKSVMEEKVPKYRHRDPEPHPSEAAPEREGKKTWETVVR